MSNDINNNPNFQTWFGDSKALDDDGNPKVLYHGTASKFFTFDLSKTNAESFAGQGFYFSSSPDDAQENYASEDSPDLKNKKEKFIEDLENYVDRYDSDELDEDGEIQESKENFETVLEETIANSELSYLEKVDVLINHISANGLGLIDSKDDHYLRDTFLKLIGHTNEYITHAVYLKMEKPFMLDSHVWEKSFSVSDEIKDIFTDFINKNEDPEKAQELVDILLDNLQYYANIEDVDYLTIEKSSFFESIDVNLDELHNDESFEHYNYSSPMLKALSEYWDDKIGEEEYLSGNFSQNDVVTQFKEFVSDRYGHILLGRDLDSLRDFYLEDSEESVSAINLFDKLKELYFLYDYNSEGLYMNNVFFDFIYSLGFDGIVHEANRFANMNHIEETLHYIVRNPNQIKLADGQNTEFSLYSDDIRFKTVPQQPRFQISYEEAFNIIEKFHIAFPNLPYTKIFHKQKDAIEYTNSQEYVAGFYIEKEKPVVGIVLENISNPYHLQKTLLHEHLGHASLRNVLGNTYQPTMLGIYNYLEKNNEVKPDAHHSVKEKLEFAEEYFAKSMETPNKHTPTLLAKIQVAVFSKIRSVFPNFPFSKTEINVLQHQVQESAKKTPTAIPKMKI